MLPFVPLTIAVVTVATIAATWIGGSLLQWPSLHLVGITLGILLLSGVAVLVWWQRRPRRRVGISAPEELVQQRQVTQQWRTVMGVLRAAGIHRQVVSQVPWYLVIGPTGAGKSTLLANTGLGLAAVGGTAAFGEIKPTDHFTIWRNDNAVFLDVSGRYLSDTRAHHEWLCLLRLIQRERRNLPLHGVLIAKPLAEQFRTNPSAAADEAKVIRDRLHEISDITGADVPSYVVITKADLLGGFKEFFSSADRTVGDNVLGLTMPWPPNRDPLEGFVAEYERLLDSLADRRLTALSSAANDGARRKLMQFPAQMRGALQYLSDCLNVALRPLSDHLPSFRGLYFTSALPQPRPAPAPTKIRTDDAAKNSVPSVGKDPEKSSVQRDANKTMTSAVRPPGAIVINAITDAPSTLAAANKIANGSLFIRDLIARIVIPDARLAHPTARVQRRRHFQRLACLRLAPVLIALLVLWTGWSAWRGVRLIDDLRQPYQTVIEQEKSVQTSTTERLLALDQLGTALVAAVRHGGHLRPANEIAAARYVRSLRILILDACLTAVRTDLAALRSSPKTATAPAAPAKNLAQDESYDLFRTYQMLGGTLAPQPEVVVRALMSGRRWFRAVDPANGGAIEYRIEALARHQLDLCAETLLPAGLLRVELDLPLVDALNRELGEGLWIQQAYDDLIRQLTPKFDVVSPENLLSGPHRTALTTTTVSVLYSQAAWDSTVAHAINDKADALNRTFSELNLPYDRNAVVRQLSERFVADHTRHWLEFISSVRAAHVRDFRDTPEQIQRLCGPDSPYPEFIAQALERLSLKTVGQATPWSNDTGWVRPALQILAELRQDALNYQLGAADGKHSSAVERLTVLAERFNAISTRLSDLILKIQPEEKRAAIHRGFESLLRSLFASLDHEVANELDQLWSEKTLSSFAARLAARFPFARDAVEDVPMSEFESFFNPVTGTLWSTLSQVETMRGIRVLGQPLVTLNDDYERLLQTANDLRLLFFAGSSASLNLQFIYRIQQREGVRDVQVQFGARTNTLYERPDARYVAEIKHGDPYGAKIAIQTVTGPWRISENKRGDWGFLRLLLAGNPKPANGGGYLCTWEHDDSVAGKPLVFKASVVLEAGGIEKVVAGNLLSGLALPPHILRPYAAR